MNAFYMGYSGSGKYKADQTQLRNVNALNS